MSVFHILELRVDVWIDKSSTLYVIIFRFDILFLQRIEFHDVRYCFKIA